MTVFTLPTSSSLSFQLLVESLSTLSSVDQKDFQLLSLPPTQQSPLSGSGLLFPLDMVKSSDRAVETFLVGSKKIN